MKTASAPGKVILCGEHAVVYGQPAIALPLLDVRAYAYVEPLPAGSGLVINAPDIGEQWQLTMEQTHPLSRLVRLTFAELHIEPMPNVQVTLRSEIPIASGMGSGAALGAALVHALGCYVGAALAPDDVSRLVYESERVFHGTPSGIDNTVVSYEQCIWFVRGQPGRDGMHSPTIEPIVVGRPFTIVIGDTGVRAPTHIAVGGVRERWQQSRARYDEYFVEIGTTVRTARKALADGDMRSLGEALNHNQMLLQHIGVSSPALDRLIEAARVAGCWGAKLSGAGNGGIMLAVVDDAARVHVTKALLDAGATRVLHTIVS